MSTRTGGVRAVPDRVIVFSSIMLYRLAVDTGKFSKSSKIRSAVDNDRRLQVLLIAFRLARSSKARPVRRAGCRRRRDAGRAHLRPLRGRICLLANTAPVAFGSIGIPVTTLPASPGCRFCCSAMVGRSLRDDLGRHPILRSW
jgi:lactate permease